MKNFNATMKAIYIILIYLLSLTWVYAQSCLPNGINFNNQKSIDDFQSNHPNCSKILGAVNIWGIASSGGDIDDLTGLSQITEVGSLNIDFNTNLLNLEGLENLTTVNGELKIWDNTNLTSITALSNLRTVNGSIYFQSNHSLTNLDGLEKVNSINGYLFIQDNRVLKSIEGIGNIDPNSINSNIQNFIKDLEIYFLNSSYKCNFC